MTAENVELRSRIQYMLIELARKVDGSGYEPGDEVGYLNNIEALIDPLSRSMNNDDLESWAFKIYDAVEFGYYPKGVYESGATLRAMKAFLADCHNRADRDKA